MSLQQSPAQAAFLVVASCFALSLSTAETRARGTGDLTYRAGNGAPWSIGCGYVAADVLWYLSIGVF